jgi:hypothetical protein
MIADGQRDLTLARPQMFPQMSGDEADRVVDEALQRL